MPRKKKHPIEMTDDELMKELFPKKVREYAKEVARKYDKSGEKSSHRGSLSKD
jgi:hypothetical protein